MMCTRAVVGLALLLALWWAASAQAQVSVATFNGLKAYTATVVDSACWTSRSGACWRLMQSDHGGAADHRHPEFVRAW
jgi:hypothetical protein